MTTAPTPTSQQAPPERPRCTDYDWDAADIKLAVVHPMRTQPRPVRIVFLEEPNAFACAILTDPLAVAFSDTARRLVREGKDLAVAPLAVAGPDGYGEAPAAALAHDDSPLNLVLE